MKINRANQSRFSATEATCSDKRRKLAKLTDLQNKSIVVIGTRILTISQRLGKINGSNNVFSVNHLVGFRIRRSKRQVIIGASPRIPKA